MVDVAKYPYLTHRSGSDNLYYKRSVPTELRAPGRPKQVWKSLGTPDRKKAQRATTLFVIRFPKKRKDPRPGEMCG